MLIYIFCVCDQLPSWTSHASLVWTISSFKAVVVFVEEHEFHSLLWRCCLNFQNVPKTKYQHVVMPAVMPIITILARIEMCVEASSPPPGLVTAEWLIFSNSSISSLDILKAFCAPEENPNLNLLLLFFSFKPLNALSLFTVEEATYVWPSLQCGHLRGGPGVCVRERERAKSRSVKDDRMAHLTSL